MSYSELKAAWNKKMEARKARKEKIASAIPLAIKKPSQRKEKPKKPKPLSKSKIKRLLHAEVKRIVLARDKTCRICMKAPATVPYHIIPRSFLPVTWDLRNVVGGCQGCNFAEHNNRLLYRDKHRFIFGEALYDELWAKAKSGKKFTRGELLAELEWLRREN